MKSMLLIAALVAASFTAVDPSQAQAQAQGRRDGSGPVGQLCAGAIENYCAGLSHGNRTVRRCLERNRERLSGDCLAALDNTGAVAAWRVVAAAGLAVPRGDLITDGGGWVFYSAATT